ncbi:hypothetical protein MHZ36_12630 [Staphylococcus sp. ACRSN]|nr:hypothetical protein [Staphylococcus sp. ACRSN]
MTFQNYLSIFILCLPLLLFIGRKTHFYYLDRKQKDVRK